MARRKRNHSKRKFTLPLAVVGGFMPLITGIWARKDFGFAQIGQFILSSQTGFDWDGGFHPASLKYGLVPELGGFLVHWLVGGKLGVNRMLGKAGIPIVRI